MNTKHFLFLFLIPVTIFAMENPAEKILKQSEDATPFVEKIISYEPAPYHGEHFLFKLNNIGYAYISERTTNYWPQDSFSSEKYGKGHLLLPLIENIDCSNNLALVTPLLESKPLRIRVATAEEIRQIAAFIKTRKARFDSTGYDEACKLLDEHKPFTQNGSAKP